MFRTPPIAAKLATLPAATRQRGAVLIVGLVILLVVTLIGIGGQQSTVLQERMAGNMRQNNIAFQSAEAALQVGLSYVLETDVYDMPATDEGAHFVWLTCTVADANATSGTEAERCARFQNVLANWRGAIADVSAGAAYADVAAKTDAGYGGEIPRVTAQPRIYIECLDQVDDDTEDESYSDNNNYYFTVTAVGFGGNQQARAILQSTVCRGGCE